MFWDELFKQWESRASRPAGSLEVGKRAKWASRFVHTTSRFVHTT